jgi:hypothetical protein
MSTRLHGVTCVKTSSLLRKPERSHLVHTSYGNARTVNLHMWCYLHGNLKDVMLHN